MNKIFSNRHIYHLSVQNMSFCQVQRDKTLKHSKHKPKNNRKTKSIYAYFSECLNQNIDTDLT